MPYPHANGSAEGVVDDVIRFAPAHFEEVLGSFGSDGAQAADEDDVLGLKLREQDGKEITEGVVKKNILYNTVNSKLF